ncbi:MAG: LacI family DNA-binding transcriptional regulator [Anaerolineaceae bacterium]|nr:LacI family DNA-binding transcriptional regulator [Anaerolineaceae bacterium]
MTKKGYYTIRDIAKIAGVTPGTISRALNNSSLVNENTKKRILQIAEDLNYTPNLVARRLSIGKTFAIGVIVPFFTRPSVSERLDGVVSMLSDSQYDLVIHNVETAEQREIGFRGVLRRERIDGALILSMPILESDAEHLKHSDIPIVLVDTKHPDLPLFDQVTVDDIDGGYKATQYLITLGHTKIGFISDVTEMLFSPQKNAGENSNPYKFTSSRDRYNGYKKAMESAGLPLRPEYFAQEQYGFRQARELARTMLQLDDPPTAIFASNDTQAFGVIQAAREVCKRVPEDLSVVGYDDIQAAEFMELTTIRQMLFESGQQGVEILMDKINGNSKEVKHSIIPTEMIIRKTTAPPK